MKDKYIDVTLKSGQIERFCGAWRIKSSFLEIRTTSDHIFLISLDFIQLVHIHEHELLR